MQFATQSIVLLYPIREDKEVSDTHPTLTFAANFSSDNGRNQLEWSRSQDVQNDLPIRIIFYGIKIFKCLKEIDSRSAPEELSRFSSFLKSLP